MSRFGLSLYNAFLAGTGMGLGYATGVAYGAVKDFVFNQIPYILSSGDIYKGLTNAWSVGTALGGDTMIVGAIATLGVGLAAKNVLLGGGSAISRYLLGKKEK